MKSATWHERRFAGFGGSDAADLMNIEPYGCVRKLILEKGGVMPDYPPPEQTAFQERGEMMEKLVAEKLNRTVGVTVRRVADSDAFGNAQGKELREEHPWLVVNLDTQLRFPAGWTPPAALSEASAAILLRANGPGYGELKTMGANAFRAYRRYGSPERFRVQVQAVLAFTGWDWGLDFVLQPDSWNWGLTAWERDDGWLDEEFLPTGDWAWDKVLKLRQAGSDEKEITTVLDALTIPRLKATDKRCVACPWRLTCHGRERYMDENRVPQADQTMLEVGADPEWAVLVEAYFRAHQEEEEAKADKESAGNSLKHLMEKQHVTAASGAGFRVYSRPAVAGPNKFDEAAFRAAHADLHRQFCTKADPGRSYFRVFSV